MNLFYLASPYTSADEIVQNDRAEAAANITAALMSKTRHAIFSPIAHGHTVAAHLEPRDRDSHKFWMDQCVTMLRRVDGVILLPLEGWRSSKGVGFELDLASRIDLPVHVVQGTNWPLEHLNVNELALRGWKELLV